MMWRVTQDCLAFLACHVAHVYANAVTRVSLAKAAAAVETGAKATKTFPPVCGREPPWFERNRKVNNEPGQNRTTGVTDARQRSHMACSVNALTAAITGFPR